jgi:hypothetical protein
VNSPFWIGPFADRQLQDLEFADVPGCFDGDVPSCSRIWFIAVLPLRAVSKVAAAIHSAAVVADRSTGRVGVIIAWEVDKTFPLRKCLPHSGFRYSLQLVRPRIVKAGVIATAVTAVMPTTIARDLATVITVRRQMAYLLAVKPRTLTVRRLSKCTTMAA